MPSAASTLRRTPALIAVAALMATMVVGLADEQLNGSNPRTYDFRGALAEIRRETRPGDTLLYSTDGTLASSLWSRAPK